MLLRPIALTFVLAFAAPAFADDTPTPSPTPPFDPKEVTTLQNFGAAHAECAEWTDSCAVCRHEDGKSRCSLPGIACQPADIVCKAP